MKLKGGEVIQAGRTAEPFSIRVCATKSTPSTAILLRMSSSVSVDEFQALEQKVLRAVEIVKKEREARAAAECQVIELREQLAAQNAVIQSQVEAARNRVEVAQSEKESAVSQIEALNHERDIVRQRVEKLLEQMDELL
jgi:hypothetical protein